MMALLSDNSRFFVYNETQTIGSAGNHWVVKSSFDFAGNSTGSKSIALPYVGRFEGAIAAQDSYVLVGHTWLIESETWDFLSFDASFLEVPFPPGCA